jgi:hypothetical protein
MRTGRHRLKRLVLAILLFGVFVAAWAAPKWVGESKGSMCTFRTLTGKPCPFCGLTRAFVCAAHGDFRGAFGYHPLWWVAAVIIMGLGSISLVDAVRGTNLLHLPARLRRIGIWLVVGALAVLTAVRLG